jgi:hypothetical protein
MLLLITLYRFISCHITLNYIIFCYIISHCIILILYIVMLCCVILYYIAIPYANSHYIIWYHITLLSGSIVLWRACCGPDESTEGLLFPLQSVPRALLGNGHSIMPRQCFLRGQFPGYLARVVQKTRHQDWLTDRLTVGRNVTQTQAASLQRWSLSLEFGSYQDSVGKGCQKSGCSV